MTDFPTLSCTSTSEITNLSVSWSLTKRTPFGRSLPILVIIIGEYRPPPTQWTIAAEKNELFKCSFLSWRFTTHIYYHSLVVLKCCHDFATVGGRIAHHYLVVRDVESKGQVFPPTISRVILRMGLKAENLTSSSCLGPPIPTVKVITRYDSFTVEIFHWE